MWKASLGMSTRSWILQQYWGSIPLLRWEPECCQHSAHWFLPSPPCCLCGAWADDPQRGYHRRGRCCANLTANFLCVLPQDSKETSWKKEPFNVRSSSHSTSCFNLLDTVSQYNLCLFRLLTLVLNVKCYFLCSERKGQILCIHGDKKCQGLLAILTVIFYLQVRMPKGPTVPKPFNLSQGNKRKLEEATTEYVSFAEQVEAFQKRTPPRYHLRSRKSEEGEWSWLWPQTWW